MNEVNEDCARYLKETTGTARIMQRMMKKYQSLGGVGGTVTLAKPTQAERVFLRGLLKKDMSHQKSISISLKKFEQAFDGTRFNGIDLGEVLVCYAGGTLRSRAVQQQDIQLQKEHYFNGMLKRLIHPTVKQWVSNIIKEPQSGSYKWVMRWYHDNAHELTKLLCQLDLMVQTAEASQGGLLRPVIASLVTKDPHALDTNRPLLKVLEYYLSYAFDTREPKNAQERTKLLEKIDIVNDTGGCTVATYGLMAMDESGCSMLWETFYQRQEPMTLNLLNLMKVERVKPINAAVVYCFENRSKFYLEIQKNPTISAICSAGQPNLAVYQLLEKIAKTNVPVRYHGDFDPEGLLIADKLMQRFPNLTVFDYTVEAYLQGMSHQLISSKRLKQLDALTHPTLMIIGNAIKQHGYAAYEENI